MVIIIERCLGCNCDTAERDCGCPCGTYSLVVMEQILLGASSHFEGKTNYVPNWTHPKYSPLRSLNGAAPALCQQDTNGVDEGD